MSRLPEAATGRFWAKVDKRDECWVWTASRNEEGYGRFRLDGRLLYAHRVAYEFEVGPIPTGLVIDHLCRNPPCVRPEHLEPVTDWENAHRSPITCATKTHCPKSHEYDAENTRIYDGRRWCRACDRARRQALYAQGLTSRGTPRVRERVSA